MPHCIRNKPCISLSAFRSASFLGTPLTRTPLRQSFRRGGNTGIQNNERRFSSCASLALHGFQKWNRGRSVFGTHTTSLGERCFSSNVKFNIKYHYKPIGEPDELKLKITIEKPIIEGQGRDDVRITCSRADNKAPKKATGGILENLKARGDNSGGVAAEEIDFFSANPLTCSGANEREAPFIAPLQSSKETSVDGTKTEGDGGGEGGAESCASPKKRTRKSTKTSAEGEAKHEA